MAGRRTRIMYIERKAGDIEAAARIGRVTSSKSRRSIRYAGMEFIPVQGYKYNYVEAESGEEYWISGPKRRGGDRLYGTGRIEIDEDAREEYWVEIRSQPENRDHTFYRG